MDFLSDMEFWRIAGEIAGGIVLITLGIKAKGASLLASAIIDGVNRYATTPQNCPNDRVKEYVKKACSERGVKECQIKKVMKK